MKELRNRGGRKKRETKTWNVRAWTKVRGQMNTKEIISIFFSLFPIVVIGFIRFRPFSHCAWLENNLMTTVQNAQYILSKFSNFIPADVAFIW